MDIKILETADNAHFETYITRNGTDKLYMAIPYFTPEPPTEVGSLKYYKPPLSGYVEDGNNEPETDRIGSRMVSARRD